jgi:His/Glu/Gln/Arg/opine family amino acid ABC transporter permease subunit
MSTISSELSFGPFAPDEQSPIPLAWGAFGLGIAAALLAAARPAIEHLSTSTHVEDLRLPAILGGVVAALVGLVAFYRVSTHGLRGRGLAIAGVGTGAAAALTAVVYGSIADGSLRLGRFFSLYFDLHLLRVIAPDLARGAVNTVKGAFLAEVIAVIIGLIIATFRMSERRIVRMPAVAYIDVVRGLPLVVLAALVTFGLPAIGITLGTLATVVTALVINASAYIAEIFRAGIQSLPRGQMDAARSLGMTHGAAMTAVVIPQAFRAVIPPLMNEFIALIKDTALVFIIVGVTVQTRDIYTAAQAFSSSTFSPTPFIGASIGYLIITIPLTRLVGFAERRLRTGLA